MNLFVRERPGVSIVTPLLQFPALSSTSSLHASPRPYPRPPEDAEEVEGGGEEEESDAFIVPRKAPQPPPMRPSRRPKSTPPHCDGGETDGLHGRAQGR